MSYYISQPSFIALMCDAQITGENCLEGWDDTAGSNAGYHNTQLEGWQRKRHLSTQQRHLSTHAMYISMQPRTFTITTVADIKIETQDILWANWNSWSLRWKNKAQQLLLPCPPTHTPCCVTDHCFWELWESMCTQCLQVFQENTFLERKKLKGLFNLKNIYSP